MRHKLIKLFYTDRMIPKELTGSYSWSPSKPKFLLNLLEDLDMLPLFDIDNSFDGFRDVDFYVAHTPEYVAAFFQGQQPLCESNSIPWSRDFAETLRYTNASLYNAIKHSIEHPEQVSLSPTSGFHHAQPNCGMGFCTFSGQVIASVKLFEESGVRGAYLDLDGHFGNSIEDSRDYVPSLTGAIPYRMNINPLGRNSRYLDSLTASLAALREAILDNDIDYVVWCHGADSHSDDDLGGGQCDTTYWVECSKVFFQWVKDLDAERGKPLPVTLSLFGGYRPDHYRSVLELHIADITQCTSVLLGTSDPHVPQLNNKWGYEAYTP